MCPDAKLLFGFPAHVDPRSEKLLENQRFKTHSTFLLTMIHKTVNILGDDNDQLTQLLTDLGKKHVTYGVKADFFPFMTKSLVITLQEMLKDEFTPADQQAWEDVLAVLIADMVRGQRMLEKGLASANKSIVTKTWNQLSANKDYKEIGGIVLFEK
jgi:hemoglobin-like flavoprotein